VRFSSHSDAVPYIEPAQLEAEGKTGDPLAEPTNTFPPEYRLRETQQETHNTGHAPPLRPSQAFVQDHEGKTHVLLFHPQDSIATNLLRYSSQLHLPPLVEL